MPTHMGACSTYCVWAFFGFVLCVLGVKNEKIAPTTTDTHQLDLATGFGELVIPANVLGRYYSLDTSADGSSPGCKISGYKIQPETPGLQINSDLSLVITEASLATSEIEIELVATTLGLETAKKSLKLVKDSAA